MKSKSKSKFKLVVLLSLIGTTLFSGVAFAVSPDIVEQARAGKADQVEILIKRGVDINSCDNSGMTALHWAAWMQRSETVTSLLNGGADVDSVDKVRNTPLHIAAAEGNVAIVRQLLDRNANVDAKNRSGITPLHVAAVRGRVDVAQLLLDRGADIDARNNYGMTPLHHAVRTRNYAIGNRQGLFIKFLLEKHANPNLRDNDQLTPRDYALRDGREDLARLLQGDYTGGAVARRDDPALPAAAGVGKSDAGSVMVSMNGSTPLHEAAANGRLDIVEALLRRGDINVNVVNNIGCTPLHVAAFAERSDIVGALLRTRGINVKAVDKWSWTPLHFAAAVGNIEIGRMLFENGADLDARTFDGKTPSDVARENGEDDFVEALKGWRQEDREECDAAITLAGLKRPRP